MSEERPREAAFPAPEVPDAIGPRTPRLPGHELVAAISQLDQAIHNHLQWHENLIRVLVTRLSPEVSDLRPDAHRRCRFGQWYDSGAGVELHEQPGFIAVGEAHQRMHTSATRLLGRVADGLPISPGDLDHFTNALDQLRLELDSLRRDLSETLENRDPLTDARNRRSMLADLREQQALVRRGLQGCVLAMIDIDQFKDVNDTYGHVIGDAVLTSVAQCVQANMRPYDLLYRYGGEEFLLCLPGTSVATGVGIAERLRIAIGELRIANGTDSDTRVSASFGLAAIDGLQPVEATIEQADAAMYRAKANGRDRVEVLDASNEGS